MPLKNLLSSAKADLRTNYNYSNNLYSGVPGLTTNKNTLMF
jgi:hypothetical protein